MLSINSPAYVDDILEKAKSLNFSMSSDMDMGQMLRVLAGAKPNGMFLELGTGAGLSTAWILDGMDAHSTLISIELDKTIQNIAREYLMDERVQFITADGHDYILQNRHLRFDYIFADTWPGKYELLHETLALLNKGGFYIIDDMTSVDAWPEEHREKAMRLRTTLRELSDLHIVELEWSTGIIIATKK